MEGARANSALRASWLILIVRQNKMSETPRKHPFKKGALYRVTKNFSSLDDFNEGEVLKYEDSSYSRYDETSGFSFIDDAGKRRRWDVHDRDSLEIWRERFEVLQ